MEYVNDILVVDIGSEKGGREKLMLTGRNICLICLIMFLVLVVPERHYDF